MRHTLNFILIATWTLLFAACARATAVPTQPPSMPLLPTTAATAEIPPTPAPLQPTTVPPPITEAIPPTPAPLNPTTVPPPGMETAQPSTNMPIVTVQSGQLEGAMEGEIAVFKGIPYVEPPLGELRWSDPRAVTAWQGVRQAKEFGNSCPQPAAQIQGAGTEGPQSEDCLYLNVWTPNTDANAKLPVMVWIHGGALVIGASDNPAYDGIHFAQRGAVLVSFNYRLGHLGFFSHPALDKASPGGTVNFGLLDQIAALKWVQANIAAFGGDPANVTIFGESAGAQSVLAHLASPLSRGLFSKGIVESSYGIPSNPRKKALEDGIKLATAVGLDGANATLEQLRAIPAAELGGPEGKAFSLAPGFVIGDAAVPKAILDAFQKGTEAPVPLIIGNNSNEATVAVSFGMDPAKVIEQLGILKIAIKPLYPGVNDNETLGRDVIRDLVFTSFTKRMANLHSARAPSWRYYFSYVPVNLRDNEPGVPHGGEIVFVFGTGAQVENANAPWTPADQDMSERVMDYWFAFAKSGTPSPKGQPEWLQETSKSDRTMGFGDTIALQENFMRTRLNIFIGVLNLLGKILNRE